MLHFFGFFNFNFQLEPANITPEAPTEQYLNVCQRNTLCVLSFRPVLRFHIRMFLGLPDPDLGPLIRGTDSDPAPAPGSFHHKAKIVRKTLIPTVL